ncbi:BTB/POZ domain-containing protein 9 [Neocloeon triangulifer]|uniref:BTB/POZ domain-containing protein 9 n=1 Tax=Neocloeon triangulifer TaxID=2078957 RepID=UPI00286EED1F|nr:BTB/POZ domain-containing protein 9 [Neocloeon triangulifer]XP_059482270.1 BTB/POZ domain-containing protein 9 [Neocloeon triangulifer]XP_059482271.1 BTB/POZ domain-containing protein 9 [Neocloeon triangulifer]
MSSHHRLGPNSPNGEVEHIHALSSNIGALFLNDEYSDVILNLNGQKFHAHKVILAARSEYFRALLYGGMKESQQAEIELKYSSSEAFKALLRYIYTGHMSLSAMKEENVLDVLGLAHTYGFVELEESLSDYLKQILNVRNASLIFDAARLYQMMTLSNICFSFMDRQAAEILQQDGFLQLSLSSLKELVSRDSFCAPEVQIFEALGRWVQNNPEEDGKSALALVRLPLMELTDLLTKVRPTGLIDPDAILDAIQNRTAIKNTELQYRGFMMPNENVAHVRHGTQVLQGEMRSALLDGDTTNYDMERGYTRHAITAGGGDHGILIKLGMPCIINHMKMLLWDKDVRSYCYYIEVSMDQSDWVKVIDHTHFYCRSWQHLYFEPRVVQYIRIVGTHNTVNKVFHVVAFEAVYVSKIFTVEKNMIVPTENVAVQSLSASVIEGVSRSRNALLNGDTKTYDWDSGYTCHQLGSGAIVVQLGQPYMLDSIRFLLWDCDMRAYSYYVEVSVNNTDWSMIADKTREPCRSWQLLRFEKRPVVFIKIVGVHNTANEVFHVVHFECPAQLVAEVEDTVGNDAIAKGVVAATDASISSDESDAEEAKDVYHSTE